MSLTNDKNGKNKIPNGLRINQKDSGNDLKISETKKYEMETYKINVNVGQTKKILSNLIFLTFNIFYFRSIN